MSGFEELHPAIQHHIVNSLEWKTLRPLQEQAVDPILRGEHVILLAPTAGGKTEAAIFPILSQMLTEDWSGLSVLYVCPIKALLNNLEPRLREYAELVGRKVGIWHGDVRPAARKRILEDPPDLLLTTPESIEVMLTSTKTDHRNLFADLKAVIVDEMHAFAGDDRGWHLISVVERLRYIADRDIQRLGLSATVGNAEELLTWLSGSSKAASSVVSPVEDQSTAITETVDVSLDFVGNLSNAATVISRLHAGEKRLVFCDSRSRVETLAALLREHDVNTFVSHSSLSLDERKQAEMAFAEGRDAVIVATSTLELGIDVGDLDRVIQIDSPPTVASFLQRLGRTGRRPGSTRNCLFLVTNEHAFLQACGVLQLWSEGFVEPVTPPPLPFHVLAQQIMALVLQESGIGRETWRKWLGGMPAFAAMDASEIDSIVEYMVSSGLLFDEEGILSFGPQGERSFGYRNFMELMTVFTSDPLFTVRHGRTDLGFVHPMSFMAKNDERPIVLLAGRSWVVTHISWRDRVAFVEPTESRGRSQWLGSSQPLHFALCRAVRRVLARGSLGVNLTERGKQALEEAVDAAPWIDDDSTAIVRGQDGSVSWWTFAGLSANNTLADALGHLHKEGTRGQNLTVPLWDHVKWEDIQQRLAELDMDELLESVVITEEAIEGLKFANCLPIELSLKMLARRIGDPVAIKACVEEPIRFVNA